MLVSIIMNSAYIVNPETKKPIKIGGRVYNKLVKDGLLEDPNYELYDIESDDDDEIITVEEDRVKSKKKKSKLERAAAASRTALRNSLRRRKPKQSKYEVDELSEQMNGLYCSTSDEDSTDFSE